jgi:hypothetical protein
MEIGDPSRQAVDSVTGLLWDLVYDNTLTIVVVPSDVQLPKPPDIFEKEQAAYKAAIVAQQGNPNAVKLDVPVPYYVGRDFIFRWILTHNIIMIASDVHARINVNTRQFSRPKSDPFYRDAHPQWHQLNNLVSMQVRAKLKELGIPSTFDGVCCNENNEPVASSAAEYPGAQAAAAVTAPATLIPPGAASHPVPLPEVKLQGV